MQLVSNLLFCIATLGFLTAWLWMLIGMLLCYLTGANSERFKGTVLGFLSGIMIAIVCFDMIPEAFEYSNNYTAALGIFSGLITAIMLDSFISHGHGKISTDKKQHYILIATFIAAGIAIHNVPGGLALGSLLNASYAKGFQLAVALLLHGIPEGLTIGMYLKEGRASLITIILFSLLPSLPMGGGAFIGGFISKISPAVTSISLSFAAGLILYTICKEMLPESIAHWKGRLSAIATVSGIILGKLFMSMLS